ncbi:MAG TPA: hypothetical protein VFG06_05875 [Thermodesulfovibrionales bacterium]|nr:hypothetical protein [Thermodesulfovibrionales bacterium]
MKPEEIKKLLERYYNAESTEEEELILARYFREEDIPAYLLDDKEIFGYYSDSADIPEPSSDFKEKIIIALDESEQAYRPVTRRKLYISLAGIAAGLLILTGSYFFFLYHTEPPDTFSDPEIAYAETMKILYDVSARLNRGTQALEPIGKMQEVTDKSLKTINKPTIIIEEKLKSFDHFRKAVEIISPANIEKSNN